MGRCWLYFVFVKLRVCIIERPLLTIHATDCNHFVTLHASHTALNITLHNITQNTQTKS